MKISFKFECVGCQTPITVVCRKPGAVSPTHLSVRCTSCQSGITLRVDKSRGAENPREVKIQPLKLRPSVELVALLAKRESERLTEVDQPVDDPNVTAQA